MFSISNFRIFKDVFSRGRLLNYETCSKLLLTGVRTTVQKENVESNVIKNIEIDVNVRHVYPEFLPDPSMVFRNKIREKLERSDMLKRRANIELPEFYVGSILAVTSSNVHAPLKTTRFVGICIQREGCGLRSSFTLRNTVDNQGMQIIYNLYDPCLQKVEVLRLEKRLDEDLLYLMDAEPEYTTFPFDMEPEYLAEGEPVPVNPIKVKLKPLPWKMRYEIRNYKGIADDYKIPDKRRKRILKRKKLVHEYEHDLMSIYRRTIPEEEQREIYSEVCSEIQKYEIKRKKIKRRSEFIAPTKSA